MKKFIVLSVAVLFACSMAQAQQLAIGVKGGLNFANINTSSAKGTYDGRTGYHFGAYARVKFSKIAIQPELIFSKQGSTVQPPNTSSFNANYSYVNVPIILKLYTVAGINIQVGPQFGFLSSAKHDDKNVKNEINSSDVSAALGLGWDLPFGLSIDARYNLGLTNVSKTDNGKNQVFQLSAGYRLFKFGN